jgi:hypothetical protein
LSNPSKDSRWMGMIRTLRITSIVAGVLAVGLLVVFSTVGLKTDPELERLLKSPSVVEQYLRNKDKTTSTGMASSSRLDEMAKGFARMINPPPSQPADGAANKTGPQNARSAMPRVSGKFKLLATSFSAGDSSLSRAYIEMPTVDQKRSWVRVGQSVEREGWTIQSIKDGAIVYGDGQQNQEILVEERAARISLLDTGEPRATAAPAAVKVTDVPPAQAPAGAPPGAPSRARVARRPMPASAASPIPRPPNAEQNTRDLEKLADRLRNLRTDANDNALPPDKEKLKQQTMEALVARLQAVRAGQADANSASGPAPRPDEPVQTPVQVVSDPNTPQ